MKRHELKFYIASNEAELLAAKVRRVLKHDDWYDLGYRYLIRSLYFECYNKNSLWDKLGGFNQRSKIRLRIYEPPVTMNDPIKLEMKKKIGDLVDKDSCKITRGNALDLIDGSLDSLRDSIFSDHHGNGVPKALLETYLSFREKHFKPFILVSYRRLAYKYGVNDLRITMDFKLTSSKDVKGFFEKDLANSIPIIPHNLVILEIKFNHYFPPHLSYLFSGIPKVRSAVSKYVMCGYESDIPTYTPDGPNMIHHELLRGKLI